MRITLLIKYLIEENLFVYVEWSPMNMQLHGFLSEKCHNKKKKERKRVTPEWTDISGPFADSFLSRSSMY